MHNTIRECVILYYSVENSKIGSNTIMIGVIIYYFEQFCSRVTNIVL